MASFPFELVSPEKLLFSGEVEEVVVPGTEGEFTVLKDHAPLMSTLKPGIVTVGETATKRTRLFVRGGFADVAPTGLTILAEMAVPVEDLDAAKIDAEITDAQGGHGRGTVRRNTPARAGESRSTQRVESCASYLIWAVLRLRY